jgi:dienelactone hydrolase
VGDRRPPTALVGLAALLAGGAAPANEAPPTAFDGIFLLEDGSIVNGGYFVEGGQGRYLYMDTATLRHAALLEREGERRFRSTWPPGIEVEFEPRLDALLWQPAEGPPLHGRRILRHQSREVAFKAADGLELKGRLLLPPCPSPHPLVVSVHGSGPVDRHGGTFHLFFVRHGMAVLAWDKRNYVDDPEQWREPDMAALSADAAAAARFGAGLAGIDADRVGYFGGSQAGWVVPRAAVEAGNAAFMVLRAGAAASQLETNLHEVRQELRAEGLEGLDLDQAMALRREVYELAVAGRPIEDADRLAEPWLAYDWYARAFGEGPISELWSRRWWNYARDNLPVSAEPWLARYPGRVLWFLAGADENVPLVTTRIALERGLAASPGNDNEIVVLPDALHSFFVPQPDGSRRYATGFFDRTAEWLDQRGFTGADCPEVETP